MKIGIISDDFYPIKGGIGRQVYEIYKRLDNKEILPFSHKNNLFNP